MNAGTLTGEVLVPFFGAMMCITPAITRPLRRRLDLQRR
jgi:hypothetical protein